MKIIRRAFAFLLVLSASVAPLLLARHIDKPAEKKNYIVYVGTYTTKTASKGIYEFRYDVSSGKLMPIGVAVETQDPSWVAIHPNGKFLYSVNEAGKNSTVSAFAIDSNSGKLTLLNQLASRGEDPCYLSLDKTGKYVLVANYTSGSVVVFPVLGDGRLGEANETIQYERVSIDGERKQGRQDASHAHWIDVSPDNRFAFVVDLGLDEVLSYHFDAAKGRLTTTAPPAIRLNPGEGPRHFAFHPAGTFVYVVNELRSTVTAFSFQVSEGKLSEFQTIPMLPKGFSGRNDAAEIAVHPDGKFLYASNRGRDSIALFHIDPASGKLTAAGDFSVLGKEPRHFAIDPSGNYLLAEDQLSDKIVTFRIDQKTGALTPTGDSVEVPSPVCLAFLPLD